MFDKYILMVIFFTVFSIAFGSCGKEEKFVRLPDKEEEKFVRLPDKEEEEKEEVAEYYVKYVAKSLNRYISITGVTVATDNGTQTFNYSSNAKYSWEQTYGPVKKGFRASITVTGNKIGNIEIYCCRGSEPFALKASRSGSGSLQYTINY